MKLLDILKKYNELGWRIHTIKGKVPYHSNWQTSPPEFSKTLEEVTQNPKLNIGVITGEVSGIIALDIDEPGYCQYDYSPAMEAGAMVHTTSNGARLVFKTTNPDILNYSKKVVKDGKELSEEQKKSLSEKNQEFLKEGKKVAIIEYLGNGRQFMAPPSKHPEKEIRFKWLTELKEPASINSFTELKNLLGECLGNKEVIMDLFYPDHKTKKKEWKTDSKWNKIVNECKEIPMDEVIQTICTDAKWSASGSYVMAKCPIHGDNNPSLLWYPNWETWNCYGCGEYGDQIELVIKSGHAQGFVDAVKWLKERFGLKSELPGKKKKKRKQKQKQEGKEDSGTTSTKESENGPEVWKDFFETYYRDPLNSLAQSNNGQSLVVDVKKDLFIYNEMRLWEDLRRNPNTVVQNANEGLRLADNIHNVKLRGNVRFANIPEFLRIQLKELSHHLNEFVSMEGVVNNVTYKNPFIVRAAWQCKECGGVTFKDVEDDPYCEIYPPYKCPSCGANSKYMFLNDLESLTVDAQLITIQEYPENLNRGEEPRMVKVFVREDITGLVYPGDRVVINGIPRIKSITSKKDRRAFRDIYVYANYIEVYETEYEEISISEAERKEIIELSRDPDLMEKLVRTVAPSIYGYEEVKKGLVLQLFGGRPKTLPDKTFKRGDIHVLLVGDPGTGKSIIGRWMKNVAPRSILTTGKGTSGVGLTAAAEKTEDGRWTIKAGALVLADKGVAIVDELDKMKPEEMGYFNESVEQQTISISKAGISTTLKSRFTLLAVANPKKERFDPNDTIADQIGMTPTLLERFDLIFTILDNPEEKRDSEISRKILDEEDVSEMDDASVEGFSELDNEFLRKYIAYAKRNIHPKLSEEAKDRIYNYYMKVRGLTGIDSPVPISERQLQSLIRLTEASARMRLSETAEITDADTAVEIMSYCLREIAMDPETGEIDIDRAQSTYSKRKRDQATIVEKIIEEGLRLYVDGVSKEYIIEEAEAQGVDASKTRQIIEKMRMEGSIFCPKPNKYKLVED